MLDKHPHSMSGESVRCEGGGGGWLEEGGVREPYLQEEERGLIICT